MSAFSNPDILLPEASRLPTLEQGFLPWMGLFLRPYRGTLIGTFIVRIIRQIAFALIIYFFSLLIDALQSGRAAADPQKLWHAIAVIAAVYFVIMAGYMTQIFESFAIDRMTRGLTLFSVRHLLRLPLDWHEQKGSGAKLQRIFQARDNLRELYFVFSRSVVPFLGEIAGIVIAVLAMHIPVLILFLFFGYITTYLAVCWGMTRMQDVLQSQHNTLKEELVSRVYDFISLIRMAKIFLLQRYITERSHAGEKAGHDVMRRLRMISFAKWSLMNLVVWFWVGAILIISLRDVFDHRITIGAFSAVIFMAHRMWGTLEDVAIVQMDYIEYKNGFLRIRETLSVPVQDYDIAPVVAAPPAWRQIDCRDLTFAYSGRPAALERINLVIPRGKRIALIGHSGAGKSTFIKAFMKQVAQQSGDFYVEDIALKHIRTDDWLGRVALVPQDVELINASLRDNIILDRQDIDQGFYQSCLEKAYLSDFIAQLPQGDATEIGERGIKLSGGQRQRLGIARALARQADIIIFDEATSSLDSESEAHIQKAMENSFADKTLLVIAHRLSTIRHADIIYVLEQGRVAESGSFAELEKESRIFSKLWAMQSQGFI